MAKKGGVQKLQEDIQTSEELERFLERPGLLVLDIYSEWCGPCLGMVGSLKKIKLESGGDNLSLAICKSDYIEAFSRFHRKSEPTWLFATEGKAVNIMFGSDTPKLMNLILQELQELGNKKRTFYDISEYQPEEQARRRIKENAIAEANRLQFEVKEKKRIEYLTYVTDVIMENLSDVGVTIFGPQVNRDTFKKITEPADAMKIQCKDRKMVEVMKEQFEIINFRCPNPIEDDVMDQLDGKELLICFWKVPGDGKDVPKILNNFAKELMKPRTQPPDEFQEEEFAVPPILIPLDLKVETELQEGEVWAEEPDETEAPLPKSKEDVEETKLDADAEENGEEEEEENAGEPSVTAAPEMPDIGFDLGLDDDIEEVEEEDDAILQVEPKKRIRIKKVRIPPIWVPNNHRTHAALVYVYFRNQTTSFLPPDPIPEPPHVIMAFDTYKKRDVISHAERHKEDVPMYGFFTSDQADEAKFIANSLEKYKVQTANDKVVLKVNKATSHTMLSLVTYGPSYVSANATMGHEEAKKFFPNSYKTAEQEREEEAKLEAENSKKDKTSKKEMVVASGREVQEIPQENVVGVEKLAPGEISQTGDNEPVHDDEPPAA